MVDLDQISDSLHPLLRRQIRRARDSETELNIEQLFSDVSKTYLESDREIRMTNHAMTLMSSELLESNKALKSYTTELQTQTDRYELAAMGANDGLWDWDLESNIVFYSKRWKQMLNIDEDSPVDNIEDWLSLIDKEYLGRVCLELYSHLGGDIPRFECEYQVVGADGKTKWFSARGLAQRDSEGKPIRMAGSQTDITLQKTNEQQLQHAAFHDNLTGLPNRALFVNRLEHAIQRKQRANGVDSAVIFIDLDRFKVVNDSLGHAFGDLLLIAVAQRLTKCIRPGDTLARLGGDEFMILLEDIKTKEEAVHTAERVLEALREVFLLDNESIFVSASLGISLISAENRDADFIMSQADLAMYSSKSGGKNQYSIYSEKSTLSIGHMKLEKDLRKGLEQDEFYLVYQPIIDLKANKISGFEALLRWKHAEFGVISPIQFIPLAEETGLINPLGLFVLKQACSQLDRWKKFHFQAQDLTMNVNLSLYQLSLPEIADEFLNAIISCGLPKGSLKLEITESALVKNTEFCLDYLSLLKNHGVELCIDDFGTGFSSLHQLNLLPFDILKIDRTFVRCIQMNEKSYRMIAGIIMLAHSLNFKVVAEGIEKKEELEVLNELGCDYAQGYYFSTPVDEKEALKMVVSGMNYFEEKGEYIPTPPHFQETTESSQIR